MKGVDGGGGSRLQLPREKEAAAATAATEPDGERAASFLRRTKIMEFSGTTQNTPQGGISKNKKRTFHHLFCALPHRRFYSVSTLCTLSLLRRAFFFSLMFYLFDDSFSLALFPSFSCHHGPLLSASTEERPKYRRACIWSLCFFFIWFLGPLGFAPCSLFCLLAPYHLVYGRQDVGVHDVWPSSKRPG